MQLNGKTRVGVNNLAIAEIFPRKVVGSVLYTHTQKFRDRVKHNIHFPHRTVITR